MRYSLAVKKDAFAAYNKSNISDEELRVCYQSIEDLNDTLRALGENGFHLHGYLLLEDTLRSLTEARKPR